MTRTSTLRKHLTPWSFLFIFVLISHDAWGQQGNGSNGNDGKPRVDVTVDAAQYPSADLAVCMIDGQLWHPFVSKDNGNSGAAGIHTFRVRTEFSGPLNIFPIEAIDPDDGTVSLWWNIWSDDPVLIDGQTSTAVFPVSGGSGDVQPQSHLVETASLKLLTIELPNDEMSFTTHDDENDILCTADLTPDGLDGSLVEWEIEDDPGAGGTSPIPDISALRGEQVVVELSIPNEPDGRGWQTLNYRIRATLPVADGSLETEWESIEQDEIDMLRQQYIDMNKNRIPDRDEFINEGSTAHFDLGEGACHCGHHAYHLWSIMDNLEDVRANSGHPMVINSGYRCPIHNAAQTGASPESQHIYGLAADVDVRDWDGNGATDNNGNGIDDDWETLATAAEAAGAWVEQFNLTGGWVHMDWGH